MSIAPMLYQPLFIAGVVVLALSAAQKKHMEHGKKKRVAVVLFAALFFAMGALSMIVVRLGLNDFALIPALALVLAAAIAYRKRIFIFRTRCAQCGGSLKAQEILNRDDHRCAACLEPAPTGVGTTSVGTANDANAPKR